MHNLPLAEKKCLWTLEDMKNEVKVPHKIQIKAIKALDKILSLRG